MSTGTVTRLDRVVAAAIVTNAELVAADTVIDGYEKFFESAHTACLLFFAGELVLRVRRSGWAFFRGGWNVLDCLLIVASLMPVLGLDASLLRLARLARLAHLCKHLGHCAPYVRLLRLGASLPAAAALLVAVLMVAAPPASADGDDDPAPVVCGAFDFGVPGGQIPDDLSRNDARWNYWRGQRATEGLIVGGGCG